MSDEQPEPRAIRSLEPPPDVSVLTEHDRKYAAIYLRLLDAETAGIGWQDAAREILRLDPGLDGLSAKRDLDAFLKRAHWMTHTGYKQLLNSGD